MADFQSGVAPVQQAPMRETPAPVDLSTANAVSSAGNILGAIGTTLGQGYATEQQIQAQTKQASFMGNFQQDLLRISDLEQQGVLKPEAAMRQYRLRYASMLANHPLQADEINKSFSQIAEKAGLGLNVVDDYKQQRDNANALHLASLQAAQKDGFGKPTDSPEQQAYMADLHQQFLFNQTQIDAATKVINYKKAGVELTNANLSTVRARQEIALGNISYQRAQLQLSTEQAKDKFRNGAAGVMDTYFSKFDQDTNDIMNRVGQQVSDGKGGQTTYTKEMAISDIGNLQASVQTNASGLAAQYDSEGTLNGLQKPLEMLAKNKIDTLSGAITKTVADNQLSNILALKQHLILSKDDEMLTLAATSKILPNSAGVLLDRMGNRAVDLLKKNGYLNDETQQAGNGPKQPGDPTTHGDNGDKGVTQYFDLIKDSTSKINAGNKDPDLKRDNDSHISKTLQGLGVYGPTAPSAKELNAAIDFFSSTQIGQYLKANPSLIQGQNAQAAKAIYENDYKQSLLPMLQEEFSKASVQTGEINTVTGKGIRHTEAVSGELNKNITMSFNGSGVTFQANDPNNRFVVSKANQMNKDVAPVVSRMVKAGAHFSGNTDYRASYDELIQQLGMSGTTNSSGEPTANPKQASAATPASEADYSHMSHAELLKLRNSLPSDDPRQQELAPFEHQAFAREWVKENPVEATASLMAAIPAYSAGKAVGAIKSRTPASLDELTAAYRGVGQGLGVID